MLRHLLRVAGVMLTVLAPSLATAQAPQKPHILYIVADDLGRADLGFQGAEFKTPTLDQLANEGAVLDQFYVQPMCTPTRAALMTGRYPLRYGLQSFVILPEQTYGIPLEEKLLPQLLKDAGYTTSIIGKWHLGHAERLFWPRQRGFDYQYGALIGEVDYYDHTVHGTRDWYRDNQVRNETGYATTLFGRDAVRYIEAHDPQKPMFMYLAFNAPHTPLQAPQEYLDRFKFIPDENRRTYAAMIAAMDDQIGNVLAALKRKGMRENTLIMFHSDNGGVRSAAFAGQIATKGEPPASNKPFRDGKGSLYEGGTRVVAFANWPGRIPARKESGMMHVVDMLPTLASLAGASTARTQPLDGMNVWKTIAEGEPSPRKEIVYNVEMFRGAVRQGDWKLVMRPTLPAKLELFNLAQDPGETTDVSADNPQMVATLRNRIDTLAREMKPSAFFAQTFKAYMGRHAPGPVFPNDDAFFTSLP